MAYEMAQQLRAHGSEVSVLALLDAWPPHRCTTRERLLPHENVQFWRARIALRRLLSLEPWHWPAFLRDKGRQLTEQLFSGRREYDRTTFLRELVVTANLKAFERYRLEPYDGSLILIASAERPLAETADPRLTWLTMVRRGCTIHQIPLEDTDSLLKSPYVESVADHLNEALAPTAVMAARP